MYNLGRKSKKRLVGVNPVLAYVVTLAIKRTTQDFSVFEGVRLTKRQRMLYHSGQSKTLRSKHLEGNAVDLVVYRNGRLYWDNVSREYHEINKAMTEVIKELGLEDVIIWGYGAWGWDMPHYQIKDSTYDIRSILPGDSINRIVA